MNCGAAGRPPLFLPGATCTAALVLDHLRLSVAGAAAARQRTASARTRLGSGEGYEGGAALTVAAVHRRTRPAHADPWHENICATDVATATRIARSRAGAAGIDLVVAAVLGPDVGVS